MRKGSRFSLVDLGSRTSRAPIKLASGMLNVSPVALNIKPYHLSNTPQRAAAVVDTFVAEFVYEGGATTDDSQLCLASESGEVAIASLHSFACES